MLTCNASVVKTSNSAAWTAAGTVLVRWGIMVTTLELLSASQLCFTCKQSRSCTVCSDYLTQLQRPPRRWTSLRVERTVCSETVQVIKIEPVPNVCERRERKAFPSTRTIFDYC